MVALGAAHQSAAARLQLCSKDIMGAVARFDANLTKSTRQWSSFHYRYADLRKPHKKWLKLTALPHICISVHTECYPYYFSRKPKCRLPVTPTWHWLVWAVAQTGGKHERTGPRGSVLRQLGCAHRQWYV